MKRLFASVMDSSDTIAIGVKKAADSMTATLKDREFARLEVCKGTRRGGDPLSGPYGASSDGKWQEERNPVAHAKDTQWGIMSFELIATWGNGNVPLIESPRVSLLDVEVP